MWVFLAWGGGGGGCSLGEGYPIAARDMYTFSIAASTTPCTAILQSCPVIPLYLHLKDPLKLVTVGGEYSYAMGLIYSTKFPVCFESLQNQTRDFQML